MKEKKKEKHLDRRIKRGEEMQVKKMEKGGKMRGGGDGNEKRA